MEKISLLKDKKITDTSAASNCLRANKIPTSKRNSILEELYKDSKKTRSQFVEDMRTLARKHANVNASIARVIEFEKYLKNTEVPFEYKGKGYEGNKMIDVEGVMWARSEKEAYDRLETYSDQYQYNVQMYCSDLTVKELPSTFSNRQKAAVRWQSRHTELFGLVKKK